MHSNFSDTNSIYLSQAVSPYLCKKSTSAFMSIRHNDDLRKIKPVIAFMLDHFDDIFKGINPAQISKPIDSSKSDHNSEKRSRITLNTSANQDNQKTDTPFYEIEKFKMIHRYEFGDYNNLEPLLSFDLNNSVKSDDVFQSSDHQTLEWKVCL